MTHHTCDLHIYMAINHFELYSFYTKQIYKNNYNQYEFFIELTLVKVSWQSVTSHVRCILGSF